MSTQKKVLIALIAFILIIVLSIGGGFGEKERPRSRRQQIRVDTFSFREFPARIYIKKQ